MEGAALPSRKRVGIFLNAPRSEGGAFQYGQVLLEAMRALPSARYELVILSPFDDYASLAVEIGASFVHLRMDARERMIDRLTTGRRIPPGICRMVRLIFSPWTRRIDSEGLAWVAYPTQDHQSYCTRTPSLATIHDLMHRYETEFPELHENGEYARRERRYTGIARWAKGILVDSELGRQHVLECYGCSPDAVHVLPFAAPPVRTGILQPSGDLPDLPERFFFYPAQFWPHKNHLRIVEALALLRERHPDMHVLFSGSKKAGYENVVAAVEDKGLSNAVTFLGYISDSAVQELYQRSVALLMPTLLGPTNIPPLEAFSAGCPVVTSRIYAIPQQLGDAALLVDPRSTREIADAMEKVWMDEGLRSVLIERGRARSRELSQEAFSKRFAEIVETIAGR